MEEIDCSKVVNEKDTDQSTETTELDVGTKSGEDIVAQELELPNPLVTEFVSTEPTSAACGTQENTTPSDACSSEKAHSPVTVTSTFPDKDSEYIEPPESIIEVVEEITVVSEEPEIADQLNGQLSEGPSFLIPTDTDTEDSLPAKEPVSKSRKGPPPGLLPLDQNSSLSDQEARTPRRAALKSAEKIKVMAKVELPSSKPSSKKEIAVLHGPKGISDNGAASVTVYKTNDPNFENCRGCNKMEPCAFQTTGRKGKDDLSFCSKKCVQGFFKFGGVHYESRENFKGKESDVLQESFQDHFVIEPDIEIQTLSDEFQMEFEDSEPSSTANGAPKTVSVSSFELIEKAAQETLCCSSCSASLYNRTDTLLWESMEFCSDKCLRTYVKVIGSHCNTCNSQVGELNLGKLCVRFGTVVRQFCTSDCLEKFKSSHRLCAQCQVNMQDKEKIHCSSACEELSRRLLNKEEFFGKRICAVCNEEKPIREEVYLAGQSSWLCSKPCRNAFRFANKVTTLSCAVCSRYFDVNVTPRFVSRNVDKGLLTHTTLSWCCSNICFASHLLNKRKIEQCARCQVKKYNVDMIRKPTGDIVTSKGQMEAQMVYFCSIFCYTHYLTPSTRDYARKKMVEVAPPTTTSVPTTVVSSTAATSIAQSAIANIINVLPVPPNSIALQMPVPARPVVVLSQNVGTQVVTPTNASNPVTTMYNGQHQGNSPSVIPIEVNHKIVFVPPKPKEMKNKAVWCRPSFLNSSNSNNADKLINENSKTDEATTDKSDEEKKPLYIPIPIPIPVPIYVPVPMAMYNFPTPFPVGFAVPVATPLIFPVDQDLLAKMLKTVQESKEKLVVATVDEDPLVEEESVQNNTMDSEITDDTAMKDDLLKVANESDNLSNTSEEAINLEHELPSCTIALFKNAGRKRSHSTSQASSPLPKRQKESGDSSSDSEESTKTFRSDSPSLHVSGSFQNGIGVKAWKNWIKHKERKQLVKSKLNEMNVQDMNSSLISFVNEVRKPDGTTYRADILLYFVYGLQQSFGVDRRRQNLLMDMALLPFQLELDKHLQPFYDSLLKGINSDSSMEMATCLKESHLWECQQLGVDSPIVLVFTMLYFNTKYFRLYTAEQHEQMAFSNVHKVQKKAHPPTSSSSSGGMPNGSASKSAAKIFSLQFHPTAQQQQQGIELPKPKWSIPSLLMRALHLINDSDTEATSNFKFKKPMEIPQNIERPSHCPIKHFNFYLSKCPEGMKTRRDMFYLLPEPSCTPESLVWYSTQPVPREILARMLRRVLLIEEVLNNLCATD